MLLAEIERLRQCLRTSEAEQAADMDAEQLKRGEAAADRQELQQRQRAGLEASGTSGGAPRVPWCLECAPSSVWHGMRVEKARTPSRRVAAVTPRVFPAAPPSARLTRPDRTPAELPTEEGLAGVFMPRPPLRTAARPYGWRTPLSASESSR